MSAHEHTPGPWNLVWWGNETYPYPLSILADNDGAWVTRDGTVSSEANARLIAAAPDMLAALQEVQQAMASFVTVANEIGVNGADGIYLGHAMDVEAKARDAIARATGEAPEQPSPAQLACQGEYFGEDAS